jgi:hypothetical protein
MLARWRHRRGQFLRLGLQSVLEDRWVYLRLLHHPLIVAMYRDPRPGVGQPPSYLPGDTVARALVDVVRMRQQCINAGPNQSTPLTLQGLRDAVDSARREGLVIGTALSPLIDRAGSLTEVFDEITAWYDAGMNRVSGWFKADTQKSLFALGLLVATALNIDAISMATHLARAPQGMDQFVSDTLSAYGQQPVPDSVAELHALRATMTSGELPVGYACLGSSQSARRSSSDAGSGSHATRCIEGLTALGVSGVLLKLVGFLITALAVTLGAPFWFDLASRVTRIRASGPRPLESK